MHINRVIKYFSVTGLMVYACTCFTGCQSINATFADGTTINGYDVSGMTASQAKQSLKQTASTMTPVIEYDGQEIEIPTSQISYKYNRKEKLKLFLNLQQLDLNNLSDTEATVTESVSDGSESDVSASGESESDVSSESEYASTESVLQDSETAAETADNKTVMKQFLSDSLFTYNDSALRTFLDDLVDQYSADFREGEESVFTYDSASQQFIYTDVDPGNTIDPDALYEKVSTALARGEENIVVDDSCYVIQGMNPDSVEATKILIAANELLDTELTYTFNCDLRIRITKNTISRWISIDEDNNVIIDEDKVQATIDDWNDKFTSDEIGFYFTCTDGEKISLETDSEETVTADVEAFKEDIIEKLQNHESGNYDIPLEGNVEDQIPDFEGTYVEVDINSQKLYMYKDGEIILTSDVVTGCYNSGTTTPTGLFQVNNKKLDITLTGEDYESPVDYWIPFIGSAVGFHDASWRSTFGGDIYISNGSHGCVNMPTENAEFLYNNIEVGCWVIIH